MQCYSGLSRVRVIPSHRQLHLHTLRAVSSRGCRGRRAAALGEAQGAASEVRIPPARDFLPPTLRDADLPTLRLALQDAEAKRDEAEARLEKEVAQRKRLETRVASLREEAELQKELEYEKYHDLHVRLVRDTCGFGIPQLIDACELKIEREYRGRSRPQTREAVWAVLGKVWPAMETCILEALPTWEKEDIPVKVMELCQLLPSDTEDNEESDDELDIVERPLTQEQMVLVECMARMMDWNYTMTYLDDDTLSDKGNDDEDTP